MKMLKSLSLFAALLGVCASIVQAAEPKVGDAAPDFSLVGSDGKTYKLSDFKGQKAVVVAWFPKAFTGGCTAECKSLKENSETLKKFEAAYFTASTDTAEKNKEFAESLMADYPILSDPSQETAKAYGVVNEERKVPFRWTFYIGKDGKIQHIDKEVKAGSHGADMAAKLRELGVPEKK